VSVASCVADFKHWLNGSCNLFKASAAFSTAFKRAARVFKGFQKHLNCFSRL
jgi:hypothetical protein